MLFWHKKKEPQIIENRSEEELFSCRSKVTITGNTLLKVAEGFTAVIRYANQEVVFHDYIQGPFEQKLKISDLPVYTNFGKATFPITATIIFVNQEKAAQVRFTSGGFELVGEGNSIPAKIKGNLRFRIPECREFVRKQPKILPPEPIFREELAMKAADFICDYLHTFARDNAINPLSLHKKTSTVSKLIEPQLKSFLSEKYGIDVTFAEITAIGFDISSEGYAYFAAKRKKSRKPTE